MHLIVLDEVIELVLLQACIDNTTESDAEMAHLSYSMLDTCDFPMPASCQQQPGTTDFPVTDDCMYIHVHV